MSIASQSRRQSLTVNDDPRSAGYQYILLKPGFYGKVSVKDTKLN